MLDDYALIISPVSGEPYVEYFTLFNLHFFKNEVRIVI